MNCVCCKRFGNARLMGGGSKRIIEFNGKRLNFEMHRMFGPWVLNADGDPAHKQPGPHSKFWTAVTLWVAQGSHIDAEGLCVWVEPTQLELVHLGGRHYAIAGSALALNHEEKS